MQTAHRRRQDLFYHLRRRLLSRRHTGRTSGTLQQKIPLSFSGYGKCQRSGSVGISPLRQKADHRQSCRMEHSPIPAFSHFDPKHIDPWGRVLLSYTNGKSTKNPGIFGGMSSQCAVYSTNSKSIPHRKRIIFCFAGIFILISARRGSDGRSVKYITP